MDQLPFWTTPLFVLTTAATLFMLYRAIRVAAPRQAPWIGSLLLGWLALQAVLAARGFFLNTTALPPRFIFAVGPPLLLIVTLFATARGRAFIDRLPADTLTWMQTVRFPVELVLFGLFTAKLVPQLMTFEGRNFDIVSGLTAPLVAYFGYVRPRLSRGVLVAWNVVVLALAVNIVAHAVLSAPTPLQRLAFEQPNVGVLHAPFIWLPAFVVPAVLLGMLACLRQLMRPRPALAGADQNHRPAPSQVLDVE